MDRLSRRQLMYLGLSFFAFDFLKLKATHSGEASGFALDRVTGTLARVRSNFHWTYENEQRSEEFLPFLENVFHLLPSESFHQMIREATLRFETDPEIYGEIIRRLPEIKPLFSEITYALPALKAQKAEMTRQTLSLLGKQRKVNGYLEVGSPGRYYSSLKESLEITGPVYLFNDVEPSFSPSDILERNSVRKVGQYVSMGDYDPLSPREVPEKSLDLVTNFIGFHHCPADKKTDFILGLKRSLRLGGRMLLRDHDVTDDNKDVLVGLAHDVFNAGLSIPWEQTAKQIRNFQTLKEIQKDLAKLGFKHEGAILFQKGDPTLNGLMQFVRVT